MSIRLLVFQIESPYRVAFSVLSQGCKLNVHLFVVRPGYSFVYFWQFQVDWLGWNGFNERPKFTKFFLFWSHFLKQNVFHAASKQKIQWGQIEWVIKEHGQGIMFNKLLLYLSNLIKCVKFPKIIQTNVASLIEIRILSCILVVFTKLLNFEKYKNFTKHSENEQDAWILSDWHLSEFLFNWHFILVKLNQRKFLLIDNSVKC